MADVADELFAAIAAAPDDDSPRHVWADAIGGERGELVAIQLALAAARDEAPAHVGALLRRERELLAANGAAWARLPAVSRATFRRGVIEGIEVDAAGFHVRARLALAGRAVVRELAVGGLVEDVGSEREPVRLRDFLRALPAVTAALTAVTLGPVAVVLPSLRDGRVPRDRTASAIHQLVAAGAARLRALSLRELEPEAAEALATSRLAARLERLSVGSAFSQTVAPVAHAAVALRALEYGGWVDGDELLPALPAQLQELSLTMVRRRDLDPLVTSLAATGFARSLRVLQLPRCRLAAAGGAALARLAGLRALDLGRVDLSDAARAELVRATLPQLRALRIRHDAEAPAWTTAFARMFGHALDQLVVVDLERSGLDTSELAALVAGDVHVIRDVDVATTLAPDRPPRLPPWHDPSVTLGPRA